MIFVDDNVFISLEDSGVWYFVTRFVIFVTIQYESELAAVSVQLEAQQPTLKMHSWRLLPLAGKGRVLFEDIQQEI